MRNHDVTQQRISEKAHASGLELTTEHWDVINFVLDVYDSCEECRNARDMLNMMDKQFKEEGGRKYLYRLFPEGPVRQVHDLAKIPSLNYERDLGFGTSY